MSSVRSHLSLTLNGRPITLSGPDAFLPLTDYLRRRRHLTGSKIVCAEGDCGACSVLVKRPGDTHHQTICGCIALTASLGDCDILTVEGLGTSHTPSPVQQAFVTHHAAQCGFCTPGLVVATTGALARGCDRSRDCMTRELVGNLCRCTGYTAILDAATSVTAERQSLLPAGEGGGARGGTPPDEGERVNPSEPLTLTSSTQTFHQPTTELQAVTFKSEHPHATLYAGGTDLGVAINKGKPAPAVILSTTALPGWRDITVANNHITVGGAATLEHLKQATKATFPALCEYLDRFASPQIRMAATLAGNIATASPIGDTLPPLLALEATVELISFVSPLHGEVGGTPPGEGRPSHSHEGIHRRTIPLTTFFLAYRKTALQPNELISKITIPIPEQGGFFYKISKRRDVDISSVSAAFVPTPQGLRVAVGGVAATPKRLPQTEAHLVNKPLTPELLNEAAQIALTETTPLSDMRGSETYRKTLLTNLFQKFAQDSAAGGQK